MASRACETCGAQVLDQDARKHEAWHETLGCLLREIESNVDYLTPAVL